jgi:serine/threonine protein kinase
MKHGRYEPGDTITARYRTVRFIGAGGFAAVYEATDLEIHRAVAIKVMNPNAISSDPDEQQVLFSRFRQEAQAAAAISHPNVVGIYDFGSTDRDEFPFIVMEMLRGHSLEDEIERNGPIDQVRATSLFIGSLEALGEAHRLGIVHKDLKPANLILTNPGTRKERLVVVDFGVARVRDIEHTAGLGVIGTVQYLAPEYITSKTVTPALDVYQMGLVFAEMLMGRPVIEYDADTNTLQNQLEAVNAHRQGKLPIPPALKTMEVWATLERALALAPEDRFADGDAFADALHELQSEFSLDQILSGGHPISLRQTPARPLTTPQRPLRPFADTSEPTTKTPSKALSTPSEDALVPVPEGALRPVAQRGDTLLPKGSSLGESTDVDNVQRLAGGGKTDSGDLRPFPVEIHPPSLSSASTAQLQETMPSMEVEVLSGHEEISGGPRRTALIVAATIIAFLVVAIPAAGLVAMWAMANETDQGSARTAPSTSAPIDLDAPEVAPDPAAPAIIPVEAINTTPKEASNPVDSLPSPPAANEEAVDEERASPPAERPNRKATTTARNKKRKMRKTTKTKAETSAPKRKLPVFISPKMPKKSP